MKPLLGCIADDFTGATDLASNLVEAGMRTVQWLGVPKMEDCITADAVVIALKTRSLPHIEAIRQSLAALQALQAIGASRFYFKYCSTFDSTDQGNIGPVAEALLNALSAPQTIFCPAFPENGRTIYQGHLFVREKLLNESGMQNHPLNPMTDANLVRVLGRQVTRPVGLLPYQVVQRGAAAVQAALLSLGQAGHPFVVADALDAEHLRTLGAACAGMLLVTASSGLATELPSAYRALGLLRVDSKPASLPTASGRSVILSGSCSTATQQQVVWMKARCPTFFLDPRECVLRGEGAIGDALKWANRQEGSQPLLIYTTGSPDDVAGLQTELGRETVAEAVEAAFARIAATLVAECGVRRLIIAGGETAGAIVSRLGVKTLRIGPRIVPGVPWTESIGERPLALALKSGNFGGSDFFQVALEMLP